MRGAARVQNKKFSLGVLFVVLRTRSRTVVSAVPVVWCVLDFIGTVYLQNQA